MLWVKGALVRRGMCPGAEGCEAGWELQVGRHEGWALEATLRGLGGRGWEQALPPHPCWEPVWVMSCLAGLAPQYSECRQDKMRFVPSPPCRAAAA